MYKTMAVERLERFINDNYVQMFRVAACKVGECEAGDVVHDTYISLMKKEERGQGHFDESYGTSYEAYIYGALYGIIKGRNKMSVEITETALMTIGNEEVSTSFLDNREYIEPAYEDVFTGDSMEVCEGLLSVCAGCGTDASMLVRAVRGAETLNKSLIHKLFTPLRRAAKSNHNIMSVVEDFVTIYSTNPSEVEKCLERLGVSA